MNSSGASTLNRSHLSAVPQSILLIDRPDKVESLVRSGILSCSVQIDFCMGRKRDALKRIEQSPPDLIISSLEYDDGNAIELVSEMQSKVGAIPSIFITEPAQLEMQKQLLKMGAFDVVQRPFEMPDLMQKIDRAVRHSRGYGKKTRIESFLEYQKLTDESKTRGILVSELIDLLRVN
jgi:DNA-binding NtrC family response regulator